mmetsp:Transcript_7459/g.16916  ORF Transcript_7459/g.16916 Transcript_7459/m.16916 type:complete len:90 (-) Transcript_7459:628-897(-)
MTSDWQLQRSCSSKDSDDPSLIHIDYIYDSGENMVVCSFYKPDTWYVSQIASLLNRSVQHTEARLQDQRTWFLHEMPKPKRISCSRNRR